MASIVNGSLEARFLYWRAQLSEFTGGGGGEPKSLMIYAFWLRSHIYLSLVIKVSALLCGETQEITCRYSIFRKYIAKVTFGLYFWQLCCWCNDSKYLTSAFKLQYQYNMNMYSLKMFVKNRDLIQNVIVPWCCCSWTLVEDPAELLP